MLRTIRDAKPQSIAELARLTKGGEPNLLRTLGKLEAFGLLEMRTASARAGGDGLMLHLDIDPYAMRDKIRSQPRAVTLRPRTGLAVGRCFRAREFGLFSRTGAFSLHSPPQRLFRAPGEPAGSAKKSASGSPCGGSRMISRALGRARPRGRARDRSARVGRPRRFEKRGRAAPSRAYVSGNRGSISAIPPICQAIFSSSVGSAGRGPRGATVLR